MTDLMTADVRNPAIMRWAAKWHDVGTIVQHLRAAYAIAQGYAEHTTDEELLRDGVSPRIRAEYDNLAIRLADALADAESLNRDRASYSVVDRDGQSTSEARWRMRWMEAAE
jgi:hypothetical protein